MARPEHVNLTVRDADAFAAALCDLFGWRVRWAGPVLDGAGRSVHVGGAHDYLALHAPSGGVSDGPSS